MNLRLLLRISAAAFLVPGAALALTPTPSTTEGPYYPFNSGQTLSTAWFTGEAADNDLTRIYSTSTQCRGTIMLLSGTLVDSNGTPIAGGEIELWEADNGGIYYYVAGTNNYAARDTNFQFYGKTTTDSAGAWSFRCIKPGLYTGRIRHLHYKVNVGGSTKLTSQFMFAEDSASFSGDNVASPLVAAGTMSLTTLSPVSGTDSAGNAVIIATKQVVLSGTYATTPTAEAPLITTAPTAAAVGTGESVTFAVAATGSGALSYQWRKDGVAISGATSSWYTLASPTPSSSGSYTIVVTNTVGTSTASTTSSAAPLLVTTPTALSTHALINLSTRAYLQSSSSVLIAGFTVQTADGKKTLVRAVGPTLSTLGVTGAVADPSLEIYNAAGTRIATNDSWSSSLASTFSSLGAFALDAGSKDAALTVTLPNGGGTAQVRGNAAGIALVEAYDADSATPSSRLTNLSARAYVGTGSNVLVAGFVIQGTGGKRILIRGIGPSLSTFGLTGLLADPKLEVYNAAGTKIAENNDWSSALATTFSSLGAFSLTAGSKDAALLVTLPAGASYTVIVAGVGTSTGEALVEFYEVP